MQHQIENLIKLETDSVRIYVLDATIALKNQNMRIQSFFYQLSVISYQSSVISYQSSEKVLALYFSTHEFSCFNINLETFVELKRGRNPWEVRQKART